MNRALCVGGTLFALGLGGFTFRATAFCAGLAFTLSLGLPFSLSVLSLFFSAFTLFALGLRLSLLFNPLPFSPLPAFTLFMRARYALIFFPLPFLLGALLPCALSLLAFQFRLRSPQAFLLFALSLLAFMFRLRLPAAFCAGAFLARGARTSGLGLWIAFLTGATEVVLLALIRVS